MAPSKQQGRTVGSVYSMQDADLNQRKIQSASKAEKAASNHPTGEDVASSGSNLAPAATTQASNRQKQRGSERELRPAIDTAAVPGSLGKTPSSPPGTPDNEFFRRIQKCATSYPDQALADVAKEAILDHVQQPIGRLNHEYASDLLSQPDARAVLQRVTKDGFSDWKNLEDKRSALERAKIEFEAANTKFGEKRDKMMGQFAKALQVPTEEDKKTFGLRDGQMDEGDRSLLLGLLSFFDDLRSRRLLWLLSAPKPMFHLGPTENYVRWCEGKRTILYGVAGERLYATAGKLEQKMKIHPERVPKPVHAMMQLVTSDVLARFAIIISHGPRDWKVKRDDLRNIMLGLASWVMKGATTCAEYKLGIKALVMYWYRHCKEGDWDRIGFLFVWAEQILWYEGFEEGGKSWPGTDITAFRKYDLPAKGETDSNSFWGWPSETGGNVDSSRKKMRKSVLDLFRSVDFRTDPAMGEERAVILASSEIGANPASCVRTKNLMAWIEKVLGIDKELLRLLSCVMLEIKESEDEKDENGDEDGKDSSQPFDDNGHSKGRERGEAELSGMPNHREHHGGSSAPRGQKCWPPRPSHFETWAMDMEKLCGLWENFQNEMKQIGAMGTIIDVPRGENDWNDGFYAIQTGLLDQGIGERRTHVKGSIHEFRCFIHGQVAKAKKNEVSKKKFLSECFITHNTDVARAVVAEESMADSLFTSTTGEGTLFSPAADFNKGCSQKFRLRMTSHTPVIARVFGINLRILDLNNGTTCECSYDAISHTVFIRDAGMKGFHVKARSDMKTIHLVLARKRYRYLKVKSDSSEGGGSH